VSPVA